MLLEKMGDFRQASRFAHGSRYLGLSDMFRELFKIVFSTCGLSSSGDEVQSPFQTRGEGERNERMRAVGSRDV